MKPIIFIHTNDPQLVAATVNAYSLTSRSRHPESFEVRLLRLEETPHLHRREGERFVADGHLLTWRNREAQSHSLLRMMVPQILGFHGRALVLDPDVFALGDVAELLASDMCGKAIVCRTRPGHYGGAPRHYASSVMLLDCSQLTHWRWDERIDAIFRREMDPYPWLFLLREPPDSIGALAEEWNHFDTLTASTKILHNTERSTQPWKTGLPIDYGLDWIGARRLRRPASRVRLRALARRIINPPAPPPRVYQPHPDPRQEWLFFQLLRECLDGGVVSEEFLAEQIRLQYLRPDAFDLIARGASSR